MINSLKVLKLYGTKQFLIQNYVHSGYFANCISTFSSLKNFKTYVSRREKFKKKISGITETNFRYNNVFLQTLGSGAHGAPQSLIVQSHYHRFLFNCGDGTRRIAVDNNLEFRFFTRVFLTSFSWEKASGLFGFVIREDKPAEEMMPIIRRVCGPTGLVKFFEKFSTVFRIPPINDNILELKSEEMNINENFIVKSIALYPAESKISTSMKSSKYVLAYICTFPSEAGILSTEKLIYADVPPGPLVHDLREGLSVTLPDGRIVDPSDVSNHRYKSSSFIVLEIPSVEYLDALISNKDFDKYKEGTCVNPEENNLKIIVHFSPPEVMKVSRYRQWVNSFPSSVSHLVINSNSSCLGLHSPIKMQYQLNHISPNIFPLFRNPGVPFVDSESDTSNEEEIENIPFTSEYQFKGATVQSNSALMYLFRPSEKFMSSSCPVVDPNQFIKDLQEYAQILNSIKELKTVFSELELKNNSSHQNLYPSVLFLGTGASHGERTRNDSSILIKLRSNSCIMLDCGRGTLNQLIRLMGKHETNSTLRDLKLIFISHIHQDHHIGLPDLIIERRKAFLETGVKNPSPLYVLMPREVHDHLKNVQFCFDLDTQNIEFINNINFEGDLKKRSYKSNQLINYLELETLSTTLVHHCRNSFGIALQHRDGWKIVYSGDCRPTKGLVKIGRDCDLLIHEATFENELFDDAERTNHSTVSQAVKMGKNMNAKFTILTHFSQRYRKLPLLDDDVCLENVGIAFDNMKVNFQDLPYLRHIYPTLKEMFFKEYQDSADKRYRRLNFYDKRS